MKHWLSCMLVFALVAGGSVFGQTSPKQTKPSDNTGVNKRDRGTEHPTASQQKNNSGDLEITRRIRQSITEDKGLSSYAKNIKVITQNGNVTLRGPVRSEDERKSVEAKAAGVAGAGHVKNEIEIAAKQIPKKTR